MMLHILGLCTNFSLLQVCLYNQLYKSRTPRAIIRSIAKRGAVVGPNY